MRLPEQFKKNGFTYRQVKRENDVAIYAQMSSNRIVAYEVAVIRKNTRSKRGKLKAKFLPENAELYPSTSDWGTHGFTCFTLEQAERRAEALRLRQNAGNVMAIV